jgi:hypothetical protein
MIRYATVDNGIRPLSPGALFWNSSDILTQPVDMLGRVVQGQPITLSALVQNTLGSQAVVRVKVDFYWADPSLGIARAILIGSKVINAIPAGQDALVECPNKWIPQFVNGGHECLVVQCSCVTDPLKHPFRPDLDRRVAQRNIMVLSALAGQEGNKMVLTFGNPFQENVAIQIRQTTHLVFGEEQLLAKEEQHTIAPRLAMAGTREEHQLGNMFPPLPTEPLAVNQSGIKLLSLNRGERHMDAGFRDLPLERYLTDRLRMAEGEATGDVIAEAEMSGHEVMMIGLIRVPVPEFEKRFVVHRVTQVIHGVEIGGYTIIVPPVKFHL